MIGESGQDCSVSEGQTFPGGARVTAVSAGEVLTLTRDLYGEVPLHYGWRRDGTVVFASRVGELLGLGAVASTVRWVPPQTRLVFVGNRLTEATRIGEQHDLTPADTVLEEAAPVVRDLLTNAVAVCAPAGRPAVLVSGGIDSSVISLLLTKHHPEIPAYTAVFDPDSLDRRMSRLLCEFLGIPLTEVIVPAPTADDLAGMVTLIEQPFKAQIELAWPCYWLGKRMREDGIDTVFTGEGSDELLGSYRRTFRVSHRAGRNWHETRWCEFLWQHYKNLPRLWKLFASFGQEVRSPFFDEALVRYGLMLTRDAVYDFPPTWSKVGKRCKEKGVLRRGFTDSLPAKIVNRDKRAFQSGAGIPAAAAAVVPDPERFYRAEFTKQFRGVAAR